MAFAAPIRTGLARPSSAGSVRPPDSLRHAIRKTNGCCATFGATGQHEPTCWKAAFAQPIVIEQSASSQGAAPRVRPRSASVNGSRRELCKEAPATARTTRRVSISDTIDTWGLDDIERELEEGRKTFSQPNVGLEEGRREFIRPAPCLKNSRPSSAGPIRTALADRTNRPSSAGPVRPALADRTIRPSSAGPVRAAIADRTKRPSSAGPVRTALADRPNRPTSAGSMRPADRTRADTSAGAAGAAELSSAGVSGVVAEQRKERRPDPMLAFLKQQVPVGAPQPDSAAWQQPGLSAAEAVLLRAADTQEADGETERERRREERHARWAAVTANNLTAVVMTAQPKTSPASATTVRSTIKTGAEGTEPGLIIGRWPKPLRARTDEAANQPCGDEQVAADGSAQADMTRGTKQAWELPASEADSVDDDSDNDEQLTDEDCLPVPRAGATQRQRPASTDTSRSIAGSTADGQIGGKPPSKIAKER